MSDDFNLNNEPFKTEPLEDETLKEEPLKETEAPETTVPELSMADEKVPQQVPYVYQSGKKNGKGGFSAFLAGFLSAALLLAMILSVILIVRKGRESEALNNIGAKLNTFDQMIDQYFLFDSDVDYNTGMLKGYIEALDDPYSVYYTRDEYEELMQTSSGTYSGIGVTVQQEAGTGIVSVIRVFSGSPAEEAGMQKDDILYKVEGDDISGMDLNLVVARIKGEAGTSVNLTVFRPSTNEYIDMKVERRVISIEVVTYEMLPDNIGYIEVSSFDEVTFEQFARAYEDLKARGMKSVIVDLRDNGGGLLTSVLSMLDYLLPEGVLTYTEDRNGKRQYYNSEASAVLDIPMAVLVNGNTASASELFTGAVSDYDKAIVVGTKTFGKGIVQSIFDLGDGTGLKLTTSRYYTPSGLCIHGEGITPDFLVDPENDPEHDPQLEKAVEELKKQVEEQEKNVAEK